MAAPCDKSREKCCSSSKSEKSEISVQRLLRKDNVVCHGLRRLPDQPPTTVARDFFKNVLNLDINVVDAHWLGRSERCPLWVRLDCESTRRRVREAARTVRPKGVYVDNDMCEEDRNDRRAWRVARKPAAGVAPPSPPPSRHPDPDPQSLPSPLSSLPSSSAVTSAVPSETKATSRRTAFDALMSRPSPVQAVSGGAVAQRSGSSSRGRGSQRPRLLARRKRVAAVPQAPTATRGVRPTATPVAEAVVRDRERDDDETPDGTRDASGPRSEQSPRLSPHRLRRSCSLERMPRSPSPPEDWADADGTNDPGDQDQWRQLRVCVQDMQDKLLRL
jgi:hypothetical protein